MSNTLVENYYNHICQEWGVTPTSDTYTGYETVAQQLKSYSKERWTQADDAGKDKLVEDVFNIYRNINIIPITYFTLDGCKAELRSISLKSHSVQDKKISVGNTAGQNLSRFWFPNMQEAYTRKDKMVSMRARFYDDTRLKRAISFCYKYRDEGDKSVLPANIRRALDLVSGGTIANFKPMNARAVYDYICPTMWGNVLDFSSGYGGRMIGALTSNMRFNYTGIDPNTKTYNGLVALGELMTSLGLGSGYQMNHMPSEQFDPEPESFDAAFSSPPYFNLETYTDEPTQCMNSCSNLDEWFDNYAEPTMRMIHKALVKDGIYAVNIADYKDGKEEFNIVDRWSLVSREVGFQFVERIDMLLNVRPGVGNDKLKNAYKSEGIYLFKKT
jgi:hypothetical protein|tara:strand:- start:120 stop:1277 length:1158 start_codon:yes stop_codon:yes gene_type:complete